LVVKNKIQHLLVIQWQYILPAALQAVSQVLPQAAIGTVVAGLLAGAACIVAAVLVTFRSVTTPVLLPVAAIVLHMYVLLMALVVIAPQCLWVVRQQDLLKMSQAVVLVASADICMPVVQVVALD
jgi:hypothetical protein